MSGHPPVVLILKECFLVSPAGIYPFFYRFTLKPLETQPPKEHGTIFWTKVPGRKNVAAKETHDWNLSVNWTPFFFVFNLNRKSILNHLRVAITNMCYALTHHSIRWWNTFTVLVSLSFIATLHDYLQMENQGRDLPRSTRMTSHTLEQQVLVYHSGCCSKSQLSDA